MSEAFQVNRRVRDAVIVNLRRLFTGDAKYPYKELPDGMFDFDNSKIFIEDIIPQEHAAFPVVVVDTLSGEEQRYLGDDFIETKDAHNVTVTDQLFSSLNLTVSINIYTIEDTISADEITDRIFDHFKTIVDDLSDAGIAIKKTTFISPRRTFQVGRWYIQNGLSMQVYCEWHDDAGVGETITKIKQDITLDTEP